MNSYLKLSLVGIITLSGFSLRSPMQNNRMDLLIIAMSISMILALTRTVSNLVRFLATVSA